MSLNYGEARDTQVATLADQRARVRRYLSNTNALESVLANIAEGAKVSDIATQINVSYQALYSVISGTYKEQYRAARAAYAELLAEKNLDMADKVERLELPHDVAKTAAGLRQWHMERTAGEQWGQRSSVDVTHKGVVGLHLEAIRQLSGEPIEGEYVEVDGGTNSDTGDGVDTDDAGSGDSGPDPLMNHPLL